MIEGPLAQLQAKEEYLFQELQKTIYLARRAPLDDKLKNNILSCMKAFKIVILYDIVLALDFTCDIKEIKRLIKEQNEALLVGRIELFERKLRDVSELLIPEYIEKDKEPEECQQSIVAIFQDSNIRVIDTVNREHAMAKLEECRYILNLVQNVSDLLNMRRQDLPLNLNTAIKEFLNEITNLLKLDATLTLIFKLHLMQIKIELDPANRNINKKILKQKLEILNLKLETCKSESAKDVECKLVLTIPGRYSYLQKVPGWNVDHTKDFLSSANRQIVNFHVIKKERAEDEKGSGKSKKRRRK